MKIALLGYGKMGKIIEEIAISRNHEIGFKRSRSQSEGNINNCDIAIDFSVPKAAVNNITECFEVGVPVVSGTTGWLASYEEMVRLCKEKDCGFIYASNFSLGVNIFFELNRKLAEMMKGINEYNVHLEEIHHTQKLDAPSGTAITLAEGIIENSEYTDWTLDEIKNLHIPIKAKRIPDVPGTHTVTYTSEIDDIEIKHEAHNRTGFALGAVIAAEWLVNKKGVFTMKDVLNLS